MSSNLQAILDNREAVMGREEHSRFVTLPLWLVEDIRQGRIPAQLSTVEEQMELAILLSRRNMEEETGGPFGAIIVERESGLLVSVGVNRVVPLKNPLMHAENVATTFACAVLDTFNLGADGLPDHSLVTSAQPCAMCFGAIPWSGVRTVITGASGLDVETYTPFDEGPIHPDWANQLRKRRIVVIEGVLRAAACQVLSDYSGPVYNGR